jgi:hypothetical protein
LIISGGGPKEYRNWFCVSGPGVAQGRWWGRNSAFTPAARLVSDSGSEIWEVHHVASAITNFLQPFPAPAPAVFADLADGPYYGGAILSTNQNPRTYYDSSAPVLISLTTEALTALTRRRDNTLPLAVL